MNRVRYIQPDAYALDFDYTELLCMSPVGTGDIAPSDPFDPEWSNA